MTTHDESFVKRVAKGVKVQSTVLHQKSWRTCDDGAGMQVRISSGDQSLTPDISEQLLMPLLQKYLDLHPSDVKRFGSEVDNGQAYAIAVFDKDIYDKKIGPRLGNVRDFQDPTSPNYRPSRSRI